MRKTKVGKSCDISMKVKKEVWERDSHRCVLCGSPNALPSCHYISRAQLGKGIPENIVTLCDKCHYRLDHTVERENLLAFVKAYLDGFYPNFTDEQRKYHKGEF